VARLPILQLILTLAVANTPKLQTPTFSGRLPAGVDGGFAARLDSVHGHYLMSTRGGMLVGFTFEKGSFVRRCSLPLPAPISDPNPNLGSPLATGTIAATGDVDGDGSDEVVVVGGRTIRKYKLIHGTFALTAQAKLGPDSGVQSAWCFDVCIGDVNNDDANEVMLTGISGPPPFEPDGVDRPITLYVCRWINKELAVIWNDRASLKLEGPSWVSPITEMRCVCDPANSGHPKLLMKEGMSDVSAGMYDELAWDSAGLRKDGYFVLRDGMIQRCVPDNNPGNSAVDCVFAAVDDRDAVLAAVLEDNEEEDSYSFQGEYFVFAGDSAAERRVLWTDDDFDWWIPSRGIIIDLDHKGAGALRFRHLRPKDGGPLFEFYRL
jgi:hypothetical protein